MGVLRPRMLQLALRGPGFRPPPPTRTFVGPVDVLPMCNKDFMVSPGAAKVCGWLGSSFIHLFSQSSSRKWA